MMVKNHIEKILICAMLTIYLCIILISVIYYKSPSLTALNNQNQIIAQSHRHFAIVLRSLSENYIRELKSGVDSSSNASQNLIQYVNLESSSVKEQVETINSLIASKVDGIITTGCESTQFADVLNKAVSKGIPVVTIWADSPTSNRRTSIGTNYFSAGVEAAKSIRIKLQQGASIGVITGDLDMLSVMGFKRVIDEYPLSQIKMICSGGENALQVTDQVREMLNQHPEINVIYATGVMETAAVARAVINLNKVDSVSVVGFGDLAETIRYLKKNIILASVVESPYDIGRLSMKALQDVLNNDKVSWIIYTDTKVITPANVNQYEAQTNNGS